MFNLITPLTTRQRLLIAVSAVVAIAILYLYINQPRGPVAEAVGTIESTIGSPGNSGSPSVIANVRLYDGTHIKANVASDVKAQKGEVAHVRILRRVLSGGKVYEVYRTEAAR